ncbi:hypothetical protein COM81_28635 [Priestia megaterium]|jgi:hypothetical protein|nr:hypothetical protein COM81_28635 [Priestia megaterium]PFI96151.1 hypothetical protein COI84_14080 [Priestia megaterium]
MCKSLVLYAKRNGRFDHKCAKKIKKKALDSVYFFQKTLQNEVTLGGTFIKYEGAAKGVLAQML